MLKKEYILNPVFILSLLLLLANDFFLKAQFHNALTGKISDIFGLIVFALFFTALFSKYKSAIFFSSAVLFAVWKTPLADGFIETWNNSPLFDIQRTVDYTDIYCFLVLIPLYFYHPKKSKHRIKESWLVTPLLFIALFAMASTSSMRMMLMSQDEIYLNETYKIRGDSSDFFNYLDQQQISYTISDSTYTFDKKAYQYFELNNFILELDTLQTVKLGFFQKRRKILFHLYSAKLTASGQKKVYYHQEIMSKREFFIQRFEEFFEEAENH